MDPSTNTKNLKDFEFDPRPKNPRRKRPDEDNYNNALALETTFTTGPREGDGDSDEGGEEEKDQLKPLSPTPRKPLSLRASSLRTFSSQEVQVHDVDERKSNKLIALRCFALIWIDLNTKSLCLKTW